MSDEMLGGPSPFIAEAIDEKLLHEDKEKEQCNEFCIYCGHQCTKPKGHERLHDCGIHRWQWPSYEIVMEEDGGMK